MPLMPNAYCLLPFLTAEAPEGMRRVTQWIFAGSAIGSAKISEKKYCALCVNYCDFVVKKVRRSGGQESGYVDHRIMPAPTVSLVASSMRIRLPVMRFLE